MDANVGREIRLLSSLLDNRHPIGARFVRSVIRTEFRLMYCVHGMTTRYSFEVARHIFRYTPK